MRIFILGIFICLVILFGGFGWYLLYKGSAVSIKQSSALPNVYPSITMQKNGEEGTDLSYIFIYADKKPQISISDKNHLKVAEGFYQASMMTSSGETNEGVVMLEFSKPLNDEYILTVSGNTAGSLKILFYDRNGNVNTIEVGHVGKNSYKILFNKEDSAKSTLEQIQ